MLFSSFVSIVVPLSILGLLRMIALTVSGAFCSHMDDTLKSLQLVSWNVRGLGDTDKCKLVRDSLTSSQPAIACIQESKLNHVDSLKTSSFLPPALSAFQALDVDDTRGGIITAWNPNSRALTS